MPRRPQKPRYQFAPRKVASAPGHHHPFRQFLRRIIGLGVGIALVIGIVGGFWITSGLPDPKDLFARSPAQSTKIYARDGTTLLYEIFSEARRTKVELGSLPRYVIDATIAAEDRTFWTHRGLSLRGMARAILVDLRHGRAAQGGSTITQQLVKNAILTRERTIQRKIRELVLAWRIERELTKNEILALYLNEIPYGGATYGIEAAASAYFGKHAAELDLPQAAMLASLPKAPSFYSPWGQNKEKLEARADYILDSMLELGTATEEDVSNAKAIKITETVKPRRESIHAPHFSLWVKEQLVTRYGERLVERGGLSVVTTLDWPLQEEAEKAVKEIGEQNVKKFGARNAAAVAIDPTDGAIRAMVGSRDYFNDEIDGQVNVALRPRQPGSSIKPVMYAVAFQKGFTPETVLEDIKVTYPGPPKEYTPENYDDKERGFVTVREALAMSLNIPAVKMLALTGIDPVLDLAEKLGYTTFRDRSRFGLSFTLGGAEATLLEHTSTYATLATEGTRHPPYAIIRVVGADGTVLEENRASEGERVIEEEIVRQLTDIMSDNAARAPIFGIHNNLTLPDRPVAAKTGTTQDYRDSWVMGYTPQLAVGVWGGNNDNTPMKGRASGLFVSAPIWNRIMKFAHKDLEVATFTKPTPRLPTGKPVLDGVKGGAALKIDRVSGKLATAVTPSHLIVEKIFTNPHTILYYIDPEDPRGSQPVNPESHPYFKIWEEAVTAWSKKQNLSAEIPPTEYDDVHTPENQPQITITSPLDGATIEGSTLTVTVDGSAPRGLTRVDYFLNDRLLSSEATAPYTLHIPIPADVAPGKHKLTVRALDDVENAAESSITLNLTGTRARENFLLTPTSGLTLHTWNFPYRVQLLVADPTSLRAVRFLIRNTNTGEELGLATITQPSDPTLFFNWQNSPSAGSYEFIIEFVTSAGPSRPLNPVPISIRQF